MYASRTYFLPWQCVPFRKRESGNEVKIRPCIWLVILLKANMTTFLIGLPLIYIHTASFLTLCDTVKTCYEATRGEMTLELGLKVHFSTTLCWLWGKSPDLRQKVSVVKKYVFLELLAKKLNGRVKDERRTFLSKQSYATWHLWPMFNSTGLTLTVSHPFLSLRKSMVNSLKL